MGKRRKPRGYKPPASSGDIRIKGPKPKIDPYGEFKKRAEESSLILWANLPPESPRVQAARTAQRWNKDGTKKKTLVVMGTSPDSCGLAPWDEEGIDEFWALNDAHNLSFMRMDRITKWFQLHQPWRYRRPAPRYEIDHWEWLKLEHPFPIYMQRVDPEVPSSVKYPIYELSREFLYNEDFGQWMIGRGIGWQRKYFSCSFSFIAAMALHEGFQRIELYGVELAQKQEYIMQRPNTEFWLGLCIGRGVQVYVPDVTRVLKGVFYAYRYPSLNDVRQEIAHAKKNNKKVKWEPTDDMVDEDNVGEWPEPSSDYELPAIDMSDVSPMIRAYGMDGIIDTQSEDVLGTIHGYGMGGIVEENDERSREASRESENA